MAERLLDKRWPWIAAAAALIAFGAASFFEVRVGTTDSRPVGTAADIEAAARRLASELLPDLRRLLAECLEVVPCDAAVPVLAVLARDAEPRVADAARGALCAYGSAASSELLALWRAADAALYDAKAAGRNRVKAATRGGLTGDTLGETV